MVSPYAKVMDMLRDSGAFAQCYQQEKMVPLLRLTHHESETEKLKNSIERAVNARE